MQSKCAIAVSHVHMASKAHSQGPGGAAAGADIGAASGASADGSALGDGAFFASVRLRLIAFLNNVRRATSLRDAAPKIANKATMITRRPVIELELTEDYQYW
jgi:hypothetical protein